MATGTYIEPLNLKYIFVNLFSGSPEVFFALFFIGASILAGIFRMPNMIYGLMLIVGGILLYTWIGGGFYIFLVLISGISIFWIISRVVKN